MPGPIEKRLRGPNFLDSDRERLVELVAKYKNIIENKRTDGATLREKKDCWERISREFNVTSVHPRTTESLKNLWDNIKHDARKVKSQERLALYGTGGGPQLAVRPNKTIELAQALLGRSAVGMHNLFDDDGELPVMAVINDSLPPEDESEFQMGTETWLQCSPSTLQLPVSAALRVEASCSTETIIASAAGASAAGASAAGASAAGASAAGASAAGADRWSRRRPSRSTTTQEKLLAAKLKYVEACTLQSEQDIKIKEEMMEEWRVQAKLRREILELELMEKKKKLERMNQ